MEELEGRRREEDRFAVLAAAGPEPPVAEGGAQPLASGVEQSDQLVERLHRVGVDPAELETTGSEELAEDVVDAVPQEQQPGGIRGPRRHREASIARCAAGDVRRHPDESTPGIMARPPHSTP